MHMRIMLHNCGMEYGTGIWNWNMELECTPDSYIIINLISKTL